VLTEALIALAAAGGTGLVQAVATDAWTVARTGFARLLGRGDRSREAVVEQQLERTRVEIQTAGPRSEQVQLAQQAAWAARLEDLLADCPDLAGDLRTVLEQVSAASGGSIGHVDQRVAGFDQAQQAIQGHGTQIVSFGGVKQPARRDG
jgi:hypothetical protein